MTTILAFLVNLIGPFVSWLIVQLHPWAPIVLGIVMLLVWLKWAKELWAETNRTFPREYPGEKE